MTSKVFLEWEKNKTPYEKYEDQHRIITTQHVCQP